MKKLLYFAFLSFFVFFGATNADTETLNWVVDGQTYTTTTCESGGDIILPNPPSKPGYVFRGWRLSYTPIEYLESTGTQYIDTGVNFTTLNNRIEFKVCFMGDLYVCGAMNNFPYFGVGRRTSTNRIYVVNANTLSAIDTSTVAQSEYFYNIVVQNQTSDSYITVNDSRTVLPTRGILTNKLILFGHIFENVFKGTNCKISQFRIYDNGELVRDFIPVLDPESVPCMYDRVTDQYFYNAGTGDFIAGPVIGE